MRRPRIGARIADGLDKLVAIGRGVLQDYRHEGRIEEAEDLDAAVHYLSRLTTWFRKREAIRASVKRKN